MKVILLEKDNELILQIQENVQSYIKKNKKSINLEVNNAPFDELHIFEHYDLYFIRACNRCLDHAIHFVEKQKRIDPKAIYIYLLKNNMLIYELQKVHAFYYVRNNHLEEDFFKVIQLLENEIPNELITVIDDKEEKLIDPNDIYAVEIDDHYLNMYTLDQEYMIRESISNFVDKYHFIRISRSIAVNPAYIQEIKKNQITLNNQIRYTISRIYRDIYS